MSDLRAPSRIDVFLAFDLRVVQCTLLDDPWPSGLKDMTKALQRRKTTSESLFCDRTGILTSSLLRDRQACQVTSLQFHIAIVHSQPGWGQLRTIRLPVWWRIGDLNP